MDVSYLDKLISQRWILLLRYYLPFFKKPAPFYFKVREFINKLKKIKNNIFNLTHFSSFLLILDKYSQPDFDGKIKKISIILIDTIIFNNLNLIEKYFIALLNNHKPETTILNNFLSRLPQEFFEKYTHTLSSGLRDYKVTTINYAKQLQWCEKIINKFTLKAKICLICLIASMDDDLIKENFTLINTLINAIGLITIFNKPLAPDLQKDIFRLILTYNTELNIDNTIFFQLFNNLLTENPKKLFDLLDYTIPIQNDDKKNIIFLKAIMDYTITIKSQKLFESILGFYPKEFISRFIDQLIIDTFNHRSDKLVSFSKYLLKNKKILPLNIFQELSLYALTKEALNIDSIIEIYSKQGSLEEIFKTYSLKLQNFTLETTIISIRNLITTYIIPTIPKKTQRYTLHNQWNNFIKDEWLDSNKTKSQELESIIEKMPENIKNKEKTLFVFLIHLCQIAEYPEIKEINIQEKSKYEKEAREYENRKEAQRALTLRIGYGQQARVSYQRMQELFGSQSLAMQKQWEKKVLFFDANDPKEHKAALLEAEQNKKVFNQIFL